MHHEDSSVVIPAKRKSILEKPIDWTSDEQIIECRRELKYHQKMIRKLQKLEQSFKDQRLKPFTQAI